VNFIPCPNKRLCKAEKGSHDKEEDVNHGDGGGQQLHHDGTSICVVQTLNVQVLLLGGLQSKTGRQVSRIGILRGGGQSGLIPLDYALGTKYFDKNRVKL
jgi:hypothetical protein